MVDKQRVGRFLRTLLGLLTVAWVVVAVLAPPDPLTFFVWLVAAWVVGGGLAWPLVFGDGYRHLRASALYRPAVPASTATGSFVLLTVALKLLLTFLADLLFGAAAVGYLEGAAVGVLALALSYVAVFVLGAVARVRPSATNGA